ncbi:hypothetical protein M407DRAFT_34561 [Tulasnella calospora MUT 4182]|uniref:DUF4246 domain-containing protein n=1 Tax=Tulasnella calospora MUT 4182 TaxID=1051891 RepID=A0A0C3K361_9AGAM|nr:hypothetical protein M407DRAFT_34561 [Tulasnella calospora MUT 4182]
MPTLRGDFRLPFDDFGDFSIDDECTRAVANGGRKFKNPEIRAKWEKEALEHDIQGGRLTKAEVKYVLDELQGYEKMRDDATGIQVQSVTRKLSVTLSALSTRPPAILLSRHIRGGQPGPSRASQASHQRGQSSRRRSRSQKVLASTLQQPGSRLVHTSLYCIVYNRTFAFPVDSNPANRTSADLKKLRHPFAAAAAKTGPEPPYERWSYPKKFCWIPTDFDLPTGGRPAKALSYINNIEPDLTSYIRSSRALWGGFLCSGTGS